MLGRLFRPCTGRVVLLLIITIVQHGKALEFRNCAYMYSKLMHNQYPLTISSWFYKCVHAKDSQKIKKKTKIPRVTDEARGGIPRNSCLAQWNKKKEKTPVKCNSCRITCDYHVGAFGFDFNRAWLTH